MTKSKRVRKLQDQYRSQLRKRCDALSGSKHMSHSLSAEAIAIADLLGELMASLLDEKGTPK